MPTKTTRFMHGDLIAVSTYLTLEEEKALRQLTVKRDFSAKSHLVRDLVQTELARAKKKGEI